MDLLDFQAEQLYFDEPINPMAKTAVEEAAALYGDAKSEQLLLRALFLEPEHPLVLVALYRYFYYQHRHADALRIADLVLNVFAKRLNLPEDWRVLDRARFENGVLVSMTALRFYMLALKGAGYLELRLGLYEPAFERLSKVAELDDRDRLGARALLNVAREAIGEWSEPRMAQA